MNYLRQPESWGGSDGSLHRWYFTAQALLPYDNNHPWWRRMRARIREVAGDGQDREEAACRSGSWEPKDLSDGEGGRVYATALRAVMLETCRPYNLNYSEFGR